MVEALLAAAVLLSPQQADTVTFRDGPTAELYARARVRHVRQDSLVTGYTATVRTRLEASAGRSRFARLTSLLAHESVAQVTWHAPNDIRIEVQGARTKVPLVGMLRGFGADVGDDVEEDLRVDIVPDRPWFIPRALGDSIRLMGTPDCAALHPFADDGERYYRFAIEDSVSLVVPGRTVRAIRMRVVPKVYGPSLVAGDMWIDEETADVVRFSMVFLGEYVWEQPDGDTPEDSAQARKENAETEKYLSVEAEIEYALIDRQYWMPYRQMLSFTGEIPWMLNITIPARAVTTFDDYQVNSVAPPQFAVADADLQAERRELRVKDGDVPDTTAERRSTRELRRERGYYSEGRWQGGRWEIDVPPEDSLLGYDWPDDFRTTFDAAEEQHFRETFTELAKLSEDLPGQWTGRRTFGLAWESVSDIVRYNRVQGPSFGIGYEIKPRVRFTSLLLSARLGVADMRPTGSATWRYDGPAGRLDLAAYRSVREAEPWTGGLGFGNSMNALFTGHDDADYYLALGGGLTYGWNTGLLRDLEFHLGYERHRSMSVESSSPVANLFGDGSFQPNPPVAEAWFIRGSVERHGRWGPVRADQGLAVLANDGLAGMRAWASFNVSFVAGGYGGALHGRTAVTRGDSIPQLLGRLGGPATVRGYTYGERTGRELWSAGLDVALQRGWWSPVAFVDVGDTFTSDPLVGAGVGLSLLNGLVRFNLAKGLRPARDVRFDLLFRAPR